VVRSPTVPIRMVSGTNARILCCVRWAAARSTTAFFGSHSLTHVHTFRFVSPHLMRGKVRGEPVACRCCQTAARCNSRGIARSARGWGDKAAANVTTAQPCWRRCNAVRRDVPNNKADGARRQSVCCGCWGPRGVRTVGGHATPTSEQINGASGGVHAADGESHNYAASSLVLVESSPRRQQRHVACARRHSREQQPPIDGPGSDERDRVQGGMRRQRNVCVVVA
jgi:hypothetical protein